MIVLAAAQWAARMESQNEQRSDQHLQQGLEKDSPR
jgi:hypothetical protein